MRHGIAEDLEAGPAGRDCDRALTARGVRRVRRVAGALRKLEVEPDWVLASPFARARQTAEIVVEVLGLKRRLEFTPHLAIPPDSAKLIQLLGSRHPEPASVLLVGHEPHLGELTSLLTAGGTSLAVTFRKAGVCRLAIRTLEAGRCASLEWVLPPRLLGRWR